MKNCTVYNNTIQNFYYLLKYVMTIIIMIVNTIMTAVVKYFLTPLGLYTDSTIFLQFFF